MTPLVVSLVVITGRHWTSLSNSPSVKATFGRKWRTTALTWMPWAPLATRLCGYQTVTWVAPPSPPPPLGRACSCLTCKWTFTRHTPPRTPYPPSIWCHRPTASPSRCFSATKLVTNHRRLGMAQRTWRKNCLWMTGVRKKKLFEPST